MDDLVAPETVYFHVTRRCNLRCAYCYLAGGIPMHEELTTEEICRTLADVAAIELGRVVFTGGGEERLGKV